MKKLTVILLIVSMLFSTAYAARYYYDGAWNEHKENVKLYIDGTNVYCDIPPIITGGRTLVPARAFFEKLGARVMWDEGTRRVGISNGDYSITLEIDSKKVMINGEFAELDVPAKIITDASGAGRTVIPVRFVSEHLGYNVDWDEKTYSVYITKEMNIPKITAIKAGSKDKTDTVEIMFDSKIKPKIMTLSNPSRIVLDYYGSDSAISGFKSGKGVTYSAIRYALHEEYFRIVLDMTCLFSYSVENYDDKTVLTVTKTGESKEDNTKTDTEEKTEEKKPDKEKEDEDDEDKEPPKVVARKHITEDSVVVIDPGHGGKDPGAVGYVDDEIYLTEAEANLDISLRLYDILKENGVNAVLTRSEDEWVELYDRAPFANDLDAVFFISIHNNSSESKTAHGSSVYYYTGKSDEDTKKIYGITSKEAAQIILDGMLEACGLFDRNIQDGSRLVVLKHTAMPAVLAECAFISNEEEMELLSDPEFTQAMAEGIANGVLKVLDIMKKE